MNSNIPVLRRLGTVLRRGDNQPDVTIVKALLRSQGLWSGTDSTQFGPKLKACIQYFQGTHLGPDGKFLIGDGEVGPSTWWSLYNPSGEAQRSNLISTEDRYDSLPDTVRCHLTALLSEHATGVCEIPDGSNGGDGVEKYITGVGHVPWCALFQSGVWHHVFGEWPMGVRHAHVQTWWRAALKSGHGHKKAGFKPAPADLAVWCFSGGTGHISAVVAVKDGYDELNTVGGNEGNRVKLGYRVVSHEPKLVGFIRLHDYKGKPPEFGMGLFQASNSGSLDPVGTR